MPSYPTLSLLVEDIDPAVLQAQRQVNAVIAQMPHPDVRTPEGLAVLRAGTANNPGSTELSPVERHVDGPGGKIRLRIFTPPGPRAVLYRIHGGGWAAGAPEDDDVVNDRIARATSTVVVSPDYRLAPEVTVRDQIADAVAVASWLGQNAPAEFGTGILLIGGISAGAHLAAATLLALRDAGDRAFGQFVGAHLDCGAYDLGLTPSAATATEDTLILSRSWLDGLQDIGLPGYTGGQRRDPALSPALADLSGFPPALLTVGALDPLRDDSIILAARLKLAGRDAELDIWPEAAHAFTNMATPLGELALGRTTTWISTILDSVP